MRRWNLPQVNTKVMCAVLTAAMVMTGFTACGGSTTASVASTEASENKETIAPESTTESTESGEEKVESYLGQITAIDGNVISIALAEKPEAPEGEAPVGEAPSGEKPDGQAPSGEAPTGEAPTGEKPDGQALDGNGGAPNGEKPDGQAPDSNGGAPNGEAPNQSDANYEYLCSFIITGCVGVVETWLKESDPQSPEEMAEILGTMLLRQLTFAPEPA